MLIWDFVPLRIIELLPLPVTVVPLAVRLSMPLVTVKVVCITPPPSSTSAIEIAFPPVKASTTSSLTETVAGRVITGASLIGVTVIVKVCVALVSTPPLAVNPLSCICTVTVALPLALAVGV